MKSLYKRQLIMMVGIVALSFTLLSTAFMLLSYRYIISETRDRLERNAGYIASFTSEYFTSDYYLKPREPFWRKLEKIFTGPMWRR